MHTASVFRSGRCGSDEGQRDDDAVNGTLVEGQKARVESKNRNPPKRSPEG